MQRKSLLFFIFGLLSASLVFAMGKVDAVDSGTTTNQKQSENHFPSYEDVNKAKTIEEKKTALKKIIMIPIKEKNDAIIQDKYEASFQLMTMEHTKEDVQVIIDQVKKDQYWEYKKNLLDAMSQSPHKDVTFPAIKEVIENDINIRIKIFAIKLLQDMGYEKESFEYAKKVIEDMNKTNTVENFTIFGNFKSPEIKENARQYLEKLTTDESKSKAIRVFAVFSSYFNHGSKIEQHYKLLEEVALDNKTTESTAKYLLPKLASFGLKNEELLKILQRAQSDGNVIVQKIAQETIKSYEKRMKKK